MKVGGLCCASLSNGKGVLKINVLISKLCLDSNINLNYISCEAFFFILYERTYGNPTTKP